MATTTLKQLKNWFAREIGELDYTAIDEIGVSLLNDSLKELSSRHPFESNKKSASLSIVANLGTIPTSFDYSHENEIKIYEYSGSTKYEYTLVPFDEITRHTTGEYVYAFDHENDKIKVNQTTKTLTIDYYSIPTDLSSNTDTTKFNIPRAISLLASAYYWKGVEGEEKRADKIEDKAEVFFQQAVSRDKIGKPNRSMRSLYDDFSDGESILMCER